MDSLTCCLLSEVEIIVEMLFEVVKNGNVCWNFNNSWCSMTFPMPHCFSLELSKPGRSHKMKNVELQKTNTGSWY